MTQPGRLRQAFGLLGRLLYNQRQGLAAPNALLASGVCHPSAAACAAPQLVFFRGLKRSIKRQEADRDIKWSLTVAYPMPIAYYHDRQVEVRDLSNQVVSTATLPGQIFNVPVRLDIMHRVIRWQLAKRQQGTHKTKTRAEVRGGGRKPRPQKKQGMSRQGSIRAPQWRGGGVVFGPVPRSHAIDLPKKVRRLGLSSALSAKFNEGRLIIVDSLRPEEPKTKLMVAHLESLLAQYPRLSACLIDSDKKGSDGGAWLRRAAGNIPNVEVVPQIGANVYSILRKDVLIMTTDAAEQLAVRMLMPINRWGEIGRRRMAPLRAQLQRVVKGMLEGGDASSSEQECVKRS
jgi:large subunit ribosomal protein L4